MYCCIIKKQSMHITVATYNTNQQETQMQKSLLVLELFLHAPWPNTEFPFMGYIQSLRKKTISINLYNNKQTSRFLQFFHNHVLFSTDVFKGIFLTKTCCFLDHHFFLWNNFVKQEMW